MSRCSFCSMDMEKGTGKSYIQADGKALHFCSSKCEKNMLKLGRKARDTKWVKKKKAKK